MQPTLSETRRIIAIGDIHGCLQDLVRLVEQLNLQPDDQLVFLGDFIDRGEHSKGVIDYLLSLKQRYACFFIMGNHELMYLEYLKTGKSKIWYSNGGLATLKSYKSQHGRDFPKEHLDFIRECQYFLDTENYFFAHGGLDPELDVKDNLRYYQPEDFCWQQVHMRQSFIETNNYKWEKTVVCAHTPQSSPVMLNKLIAIDTGCVYKENPLFGKLTAVILPERVLVQTT
ncbi:MAG: metallophosphoesterase family protein [Chlorobium sp.]